MPQPGWYPDPGGAVGEFRHWDGSRWSERTSRTPSGPPPRNPDRGPGDRTWLVIAVVVVVGLLAWLAIRNVGGSESDPEALDSSTPSVSAWDETSTPSPVSSSPSSDQTGPQTVVPCPNPVQNEGGRVTASTVEGGGLVAPRPAGFEPYGRLLYWLTDSNAVVKRIGETSWVHLVTVGRLPSETKLGTVEQSARSLMDCWATSGRYPGLQSRTLVNAEAVTVDGHQGFWLRTDLAVDNVDSPGIRGGRVDIVVIDTGDPTGFGVFLSAAHLGDDGNQKLVDDSRAQLRVKR